MVVLHSGGSGSVGDGVLLDWRVVDLVVVLGGGGVSDVVRTSVVVVHGGGVGGPLHWTSVILVGAGSGVGNAWASGGVLVSLYGSHVLLNLSVDFIF